MHCRACLYLLVVGLIALCGLADAQADPLTLWPYGSSGVKYQRFELHYWELPQDIYRVDYDDSSWPVGTAPFGAPDTTCPVTVSTPWGLPDLCLVVRFWVNVPQGASNITIRDRFDERALYFSVNGQVWGSCEGCWTCPYCDACQMTPYAYYWHAGQNLVVLVNQSEGGQSYMDFQVTADMPPVAARGSTWGWVKAIYR